MARPSCFLMLICLLVSMTGCIASDTVIRLNPDGSGTIVQKTLMNTEMIALLMTMMQGFAQEIAGSQTNPESRKMPELFGEKEARARASKLGEGVTFVSSRKIKTDQQDGMEAVYSFRDVTKLKMSETPEAPSMPGMSTRSNKERAETRFRFAKLPNGHSLLTVVSSPRDVSSTGKKAPDASSTTSQGNTPETTPEQLEQAKKLFSGFRIGMAVEVEGAVVKTNSLYQEGSKVTLLEMDFSELLSNEPLLREMAARKRESMSLEDAKPLLRNLKGFKVNLNPEVQIEFAGK